MIYRQSRRAFLTGMVFALAAPAIVHAGNLMPIRGDRLKVVGFGYGGQPSIWWVVETSLGLHGETKTRYIPTFPGEALFKRCEELVAQGKIDRFPTSSRTAIAVDHWEPIKGGPSVSRRPLVAEYAGSYGSTTLDNSVPLVRHD